MSNREWKDLTPEEQRDALDKAEKDVQRLAVGWEAPGELRDSYGPSAFMPRVVRVVDGNVTLGVFRLTPMPPEGKWTTTYEQGPSGRLVGKRRYTFPPDSDQWEGHRLESGWRVMLEHLEPDTVIAGTTRAVGTYDVEERRRAGLKGLRVTRRGGSYRFTCHGGGRRRPERVDVQERKLAKVLWTLWEMTGDAGVSWGVFRKVVRAAG